MARNLASQRPKSRFGRPYSGALTLEKAVFRPRQAQILAQGPPLIRGPEDPAPLQLRNHPIDEIGQSLRQIGEHDVEAVASRG